MSVPPGGPGSVPTEPSPPTSDVPTDAANKTVAEVLGEIVWLMSQSAEHRQHAIGDLEWMVMPAILLRQFRLFYKEGRPVAAVLHARVSAEIAARLAAAPTRLEPAEWCSGGTVVLMRTIAPFGGGEQLAAEAMRLWGGGHAVDGGQHGT